MTSQDIDFLKSLLERHQSNLKTLLLQKATYGSGEAPLFLLNQVEYESTQINELENNLSLKLKGYKSSGIIPASVFPHNDWRSINHYNWLESIADWFQSNYEDAPQGTITQLLDHVFEIISNARLSPALLEKITLLGNELRNKIADSSTAVLAYPHHKTIIMLLERGLHRFHSHLFMVPEVQKNNLLNVPDYSRLLLSTKLHAAGDYTPSVNLVQSISAECALAQYIIGQSKRKQGLYEQANIHYDEGVRLVDNWEEHLCPFNQGMAIICDKNLLEAEIFRGKAVVFRKQGLKKETESCYKRAEEALRDVNFAAGKSENIESKKTSEGEVIWADYDRFSANRVKADVFYSSGYYWYSLGDYDKADKLFRASINALERASEQWDSPYTRLAVVELCRGNYQDAVRIFLKAAQLCKDTPVERNREAPLSLALCTLGLRVIELCYPVVGRITGEDPMDKLESALRLEPRLSLGPLECHRDDAQHFLIETLRPSEPITKSFISRVNQELVSL